MTGTIAIVKKEVKTYFLSPVAYVLIGVFLAIMGVIFTKFAAIAFETKMAQQFGRSQAVSLDMYISVFYQNMAFVFCFLTPFLTMKLFAEERTQNTLELLMTAPLRTVDLVIGKFLGASAIMGSMVLVSLSYVFFMVVWGNPDYGVLATTYLGISLALGCFLSLGAFISAMSSSQAVAAVWTFLALLVLWLMQALGQGITTTWGPVEIGPLIVYISPLGHFNNFNEGLIQLKDVVYFVSFIGFMLFLTHRVVESNRWR